MAASEQPVISDPAPIPEFDNKTLTGVEVFDHAEGSWEVPSMSRPMPQQCSSKSAPSRSGWPQAPRPAPKIDATLKTIIAGFQKDAGRAISERDFL
ncbi:hypothetical protein [Paracoccus aestuariivivens]|uniref:Uncharacterized protein n=1 Tax=Paracoccus aestuariivivens TaxID=1820333 RepID=A0A6L6J8P7_9RHOB|nr:hypothetical protein [Paracoccus aestuariivivens]MTH78370.1 hypothetical protein [Paracoccus aestuariivivens]